MNDLITSLYEDMNMLEQDGLVNKITLKKFHDEFLGLHEDLTADDVKKIRTSNNISQAVLAKFLNLSPVSIQRWEQGKTRPSGSSLVLLNMIKEKGLNTLYI
jgi:putative transcriptional regulator